MKTTDSNNNVNEVDYYNIYTKFDVKTNKFYMDREVEKTITIRITPTLFNSTIVSEKKLVKEFTEDYPLIKFPDIVIIENPKTYCCKLETTNNSTITHSDTYPMSKWIIDMKSETYNSTFNSPTYANFNNVNTTSSNSQNKRRIEDI
jgi:hypothetical protein